MVLLCMYYLCAYALQSFVKLFARQITQELVEFEGIPGSHAWKWRHDGVWRARVFTKAQVVGVLVSIQERNERGLCVCMTNSLCIHMPD